MNVCIYSYIAGTRFWADQWWHADLESTGPGVRWKDTWLWVLQRVTTIQRSKWESVTNFLKFKIKYVPLAPDYMAYDRINSVFHDMFRQEWSAVQNKDLPE